MISFTVDVSGFEEFARDIRFVAPQVSAELGRSLTQAAKPVLEDAKARAPKRTGAMARSGRVRRRRFGPAIAFSDPAAKVNEFGWRHPVFGTSTWVKQEARPFLGPAVDAGAPKVLTAVNAALDDALRKAGWA